VTVCWKNTVLWEWEAAHSHPKYGQQQNNQVEDDSAIDRRIVFFAMVIVVVRVHDQHSAGSLHSLQLRFSSATLISQSLLYRLSSSHKQSIISNYSFSGTQHEAYFLHRYLWLPAMADEPSPTAANPRTEVSVWKAIAKEGPTVRLEPASHQGSSSMFNNINNMVINDGTFTIENNKNKASI